MVDDEEDSSLHAKNQRRQDPRFLIAMRDHLEVEPGGGIVGLTVGANVGLGDLPGTVGIGRGGTGVVASHSTCLT